MSGIFRGRAERAIKIALLDDVVIDEGDALQASSPECFSDQAPDASVFSFTPPQGATVSDQSLPSKAAKHPGADHPKPEVSGEGWATIVSLPAGSAPAGLSDDPLFAQLTQPVDGGRALSTSLVSVLVTDDGRVLAGAVPVSALQAAAR